MPFALRNGGKRQQQQQQQHQKQQQQHHKQTNKQKLDKDVKRLNNTTDRTETLYLSRELISSFDVSLLQSYLLLIVINFNSVVNYCW